MNLLKKALDVWGEFDEVHTSTHASSTAYYSFLSLVPLLALCISMISLIGISEQEVLDLLFRLFPDALNGFAANLVLEAFDSSGFAFSLSFLSLVWTASKGTKALRVGLNAAYDERETRGIAIVSAISIAAVVVLSVLFAAAMWLIFGHSLLALLSKYIPSFQPPTAVVELIDLAITLVAGVLMIALSYTYLPAGARSFTAQLPGAVCALAGCGALSFGYRVYIDHVSESTMLYGSIATVAFFLVWMYLMFYILIACGFLNRYLQERAAKGETSV